MIGGGAGSKLVFLGVGGLGRRRGRGLLVFKLVGGREKEFKAKLWGNVGEVGGVKAQ